MTSADDFARIQAGPGWTRVLASFARFAAPQAGWRTLDAGCGPGYLVRHLAGLGCAAHGLDRDPAALAHARQLAPRLPFVLGDALALPFADASFQLVTAANLLFLLQNPLAGLRELARVAGPGGRVAVLNPSPAMSAAAAAAHADQVGLSGFERDSFIGWGRRAESHLRFSEADLARLFKEAGLHAPEIERKIGGGLALYARSNIK